LVADDARKLSTLDGALSRAGLAAFLAAFAPHATRRDRWVREAVKLDPPLRAVAGLFLLGERVPLAELPADVRAALPALAQAGPAHLDDENAELAGLSLFRPYGVWLLAEPPGPVHANAYFGPDSLALAMHATYRPGGTCLDLCAGPGFQGLVAAGRCASVTMVELTAEAAALAAVNATLNGVDDRVTVHVGDLYEPVAGQRYDHVVANVPFVPVPPGRPFPTPGAGGADGFEVARRVLDGLTAHLRDGGSAHLATMLLRGKDGLLLAGELADWARRSSCDLTVTVTAEIPATADSPLARATAEAIDRSSVNGGGAAELAEEVADHYADLGAVAATWAFMRVDHGGGRLAVTDLGGPGRRSPWVSMV